VTALGPLLEASGTKIWMLDHNYNLWGRVLDQLCNPRYKKYVNTVAWHGYLGSPEMMGNVKQRFPDVEMHWTEGGDDYKFPDYWTSWCKWGATFSGILAQRAAEHHKPGIWLWMRRGRPNIGPFDCGGLVQIHSETKEIKQAGLYWALVQYARAIRRGAVIVASHDASGDAPAVSGVLFVPPGPLVAGTGIPYSVATSRVFSHGGEKSGRFDGAGADESGRSKRADGGLRRFRRLR